MTTFIRRLLCLVRWAFWPILQFELLYKGIAAYLVAPLCNALFRLSLASAGLAFLSPQTLGQFLKTPGTILVLLLLGLAVAFYTFLELCFLAAFFHALFTEAKPNFWRLLGFSFRRAVAVLHIRNWPLLLLIMVLLPFGSIPVLSSFLPSIPIPQFLLSYIAASPWRSFLFGVLVAVYVLYFIRLAFTVHFFVLQEQNFRTAMFSSRRLVGGHFLWILFALVVTSLLLSVFFFLLRATVTLFLGLFMVVQPLFLYPFTYYFLAVLATFFSAPYHFGVLSVLFEKLQGHRVRAIPMSVIANKSPFKAALLGVFRILLLLVLLALLVVNAVLWQQMVRNNYLLDFHSSVLPQITAHRGDTRQAPENTLSAIHAAAAAGADYAEIDIQLTKDGELVLMHDAILKRTTGVDAKVADLTLAQIKQLDAGSWFDPAFTGEKVPTLQEAMAAAKGCIKLIIELKPSYNDALLAEKLLDVFRKTRLYSDAAVVSGDYPLLLKLKQKEPRLRIGYGMAVAFGDFLALPVDFFSVEISFVSADLVQKVHAAGKKIFVWTVNDRADMEKMINFGVDNLLTDRVDIARSLLLERKQANPWQLLWSRLFLGYFPGLLGTIKA